MAWQRNHPKHVARYRDTENDWHGREDWDHPFKIGMIQRRLAWLLRKDDTHKSRSVNMLKQKLTTKTQQKRKAGKGCRSDKGGERSQRQNG